MAIVRRWLTVARLLFFASLAFALGVRPAGVAAAPLSERVIDYRIEAELRPSIRTVAGRVRARWKNTGSAPTQELWLHLYMNAFKNESSTFMRESRGEHRRQRIKPGGWGYVDVVGLKVDGQDQLAGARVDDTLMQVPLGRPVAPGESLELEVNFKSRLPRVFARTGYHGDFYLVAQWFPKLCVYEGDRWNKHQFHQTTEFFADFATYQVSLTVPEDYVVGATGLPTGPAVPAGQKKLNQRRYTFHAEDVHDFAWVAAPFLRTLEGREGSTEILVLYSPGLLGQARRHLAAAEVALRGFRERLGPFPYPRLTVVSPPPGADGAGGMEYPTFITSISRWWAPAGLLFPEQVTVHEFGHQYFYGILATNEFEHAWMDEGMNTYVTGLVMDQAYGPHRSGSEVLGTRLGYFPQMRNRYRSIAGLDRIDQLAFTYATTLSYAGHTYNKTALLLKTLENYLGPELMGRAMRAYYDRWKFRHPRPEDFLGTFGAAVKAATGQDLGWFFEPGLRGTERLDYAVEELKSRPHRPPRGVFDGPGGPPGDRRQRRTVEKTKPVPDKFDSEVLLRRRGGFVFPVEVEVAFADGSRRRERWDGRSPWKRFEYQAQPELVSARIDPDDKVLLDDDWLNNERSLRARRGPAVGLWARLLFWAQTLLSMGGL